MWEKIWDLLSKVATLTKDTDRNSQEIKEIRADIRDIYSKLERLAYEIQKTREEDRHEREKLALRLENEMLKFERRLPVSDKRDAK
jgi:predicted  nucleic acid-binding Zn-ribbon protein